MSGALTPVGVVVAGAGVVLIYSAVTGQSPLSELRKAITSGTLDGPDVGSVPLVDPTAAPVGFTGGTGSPDEPAIPNPSTSGPANASKHPTNLVPIGQGSHRLIAPAADAFKRAERMLGKPIRVSDSYRDYESQAASYRRDPKRFANPDKSAHVEGRAVDVDLGALGIRRGTMDEAAYKELVRVMYATGWCNWQIAAGNTGGKIAEPWHFSWGVCK